MELFYITFFKLHILFLQKEKENKCFKQLKCDVGKNFIYFIFFKDFKVFYPHRPHLFDQKYKLLNKLFLLLLSMLKIVVLFYIFVEALIHFLFDYYFLFNQWNVQKHLFDKMCNIIHVFWSI